MPKTKKVKEKFTKITLLGSYDHSNWFEIPIFENDSQLYIETKYSSVEYLSIKKHKPL